MVAVFATQEHTYYHIHLVAGLVALVLALGFTTLPTFVVTQISSVHSDYCLLGLRDICNRDDCPTDPFKDNPGICGCGIADNVADMDKDGTLDCHDDCPCDACKTSSSICGCGIPKMDMDQDGTLDCHDDCLHDACKTSSGTCGCDIPDIDTNGDGKASCKGNGMDNDPLVYVNCLHIQFTYNYENCEGCAKDYLKWWNHCGKMCLSDMDYCIKLKFEFQADYNKIHL